MHYCNVKSKQFDEVIYLSADDIELGKFQNSLISICTTPVLYQYYTVTNDFWYITPDQTKKAKLDFYLDKLAKSAAAKARNQNVAIVTNGTVGLSRFVFWECSLPF